MMNEWMIKWIMNDDEYDWMMIWMDDDDESMMNK